jgi:hypothetical protein
VKAGIHWNNDADILLSMDEASNGSPKRNKSSVVKKAAIVGSAIMILLLGKCGYELHHAVRRGQQVRTKGDMSTIAHAIEEYREQTGQLPIANNIDELMKLLTPKYLASPITQDGWHHSLRYEISGTPIESCQNEGDEKLNRCGQSRFFLGSAGADGKFDLPNLRDYKPNETQQFDCDIVRSNNGFLVEPLGRQEYGSCKEK